MRYYKARGKIWVLDLKLKSELEAQYNKGNNGNIKKLTQDKYSFRFENMWLVGDYKNVLEINRSRKRSRGLVR